MPIYSPSERRHPSLKSRLAVEHAHLVTHDLVEDEPSALDAASIARVAAAHRPAVKLACWDRYEPGIGHGVQASVTVMATVGTDGLVESASSTGTDPKLARCVEDQVRTWRFPTPDHGGNAVSVSIPFELIRK